MTEMAMERRFYRILTALLLIPGAFLMREFLFDLCNMIGAIVSGTPSEALIQLARVFPFAFLNFTVIHFLMASIRLRQSDKRAEGFMALGIRAAVLGLIPMLYVVAGLVAGKYEALVEGYVTALFPLDALLFGLLTVLFGILCILYARRLKEKGSTLPAAPVRHSAFIRGLDRVFCPIALMIILYSLIATLSAPFFMDFSNGGILFNIALILNFALPVAMFLCYRYGYLEADEEKKKIGSRRMALIFLCLGVLFIGLYLLSVELFNEAPNLNAFALLPIEFTASFHAFLPVYGLMNIVAPLAAFLKSFSKRA